jgi:ABC-type lipoprotein release transport system permease subunit
MGAVWARARAEVRSTWRAWLVLALLIALAGGAATAAAAGARRTQTAYPRLVRAERGYDVTTGGGLGEDPEKDLATIEQLPEVAEWGRADLVSFAVILPSGRLATVPEVAVGSDPRNQIGVTINGFKILSGRPLDPHGTDEAIVDFSTADRFGLSLGSVVKIVLGDPATLDPPTAPVRLVGIVATPGFFPAFGAGSVFPIVFVSPSFERDHGIAPDPQMGSLFLRLRHGQAGVPAFLDQKRRAGLGGIDVVAVQATQTLGVQRSIRLESMAMWALCVLIGLAGLAILGQAVARQTHQASDGFDVMRAVGMSPRQLVGLGLIRAFVVGLAGALLAVPVAILLSPLTPIGLARIAEPDPGVAVDGIVLALGATSVLVLVVLSAALPAWRAARAASPAARARADAEPSSALAGAVARVSASPTAGAGVRMALETGRGRSAVPVRSAILGVTMAVAALTSAVLLWTSLHHLLGTPRLSGYPWDVFLGASETADANDLTRMTDVIRSDPDVAGFSRGGFVNLVIAGRSVFGVIPDDQGGGGGLADPIIAEGRAPRGPDEIALGATSMREAGVHIGDRVQVGLDEADSPPPPISLVVVGRAIIPPAPFAATGPAEGAALTVDGFARLDPTIRDAAASGHVPFLVSFKAGTDTEQALERLSKALPAGVQLYPSSRGDQATLGRIAQVPLILALLLVVLAVGTLAQTLVTSVRARRRELAILKTLGFSKGQVRGSVAWQATAMTLIALVIGVPLGFAAGRWVWRVLADGLGVVPAPVISPLAIATGIPVTLAVANLIASIPAAMAARTRPAIVLRSE